MAGTVALAVSFVVACDHGADRDRAREALTDLQRALATGNIEEACDLLTADAHKHLGDAAHDPPTTCERDIRMIYDRLKRGEGLREAPERAVRHVVLDGDRATATVVVGDGTTISVPLAKEDGDWKVDALYGDIPGGEQKDNFD